MLDAFRQLQIECICSEDVVDRLKIGKNSDANISIYRKMKRVCAFGAPDILSFYVDVYLQQARTLMMLGT